MKKYPSVEKPGSVHNDELMIDDEDTLVVEEKLDGANMRFRILGEDEILFGSRRVEFKDQDGPLPIEESNKQFRHAMRYIKNIIDWDDVSDIDNVEDLTWFGEALHKHSLDYDAWEGKHPDIESEIPNFVAFDIYDEEKEEWVDFKTRNEYFDIAGLERTKYYKTKVGEVDEIEVMESEYREPDSEAENEFDKKGLAEGVIVRNIDKKAKVKIVHENFKESGNTSFSGPSEESKHASRFVNTLIKEPRVKKQAYKLVDEGEYDELQMSMMKDLPRRVIEDAMKEEGWNIIMNEYDLEVNLNEDTKDEIRSKASKKCSTVLSDMIDN